MKQIMLAHPIMDDGVEYDRGLHEVEDARATKWLKEAPHAASLYEPPKMGNVKVIEPPPTQKAPAQAKTEKK